MISTKNLVIILFAAFVLSIAFSRPAAPCVFRLELLDYYLAEKEEAHVLVQELIDDLYADGEARFYSEVFVARVKKEAILEFGEDNLPAKKLKLAVGGSEVEVDWSETLTAQMNDGYYYTKYIILAEEQTGQGVDPPEGVEGDMFQIVLTDDFNNQTVEVYYPDSPDFYRDSLTTRPGTWMSPESIIKPQPAETEPDPIVYDDTKLYTNHDISEYANDPEIRLHGDDEEAPGISITDFDVDDGFYAYQSMHLAIVDLEVEAGAAMGFSYDLYFAAEEGLEALTLENVFTIIGSCDDAGNPVLAGNFRDNAFKWGDPVIGITGEFTHSEVDFTYIGSQITVQFERGYGTHNWCGADFGYYWDHNYDIILIKVHDGLFRLHNGFSGDMDFTWENDHWESPKGFGGRLDRIVEGETEHIELAYRDGTKWIFNNFSAQGYRGLIASITDARGISLLKFDYDGYQRLTKITINNIMSTDNPVPDSNGNAKIEFAYEESANRIKSITYPGASGTATNTYIYDTGRLRTVQFPNGVNRHYKYAHIQNPTQGIDVYRLEVIYVPTTLAYESLPANDSLSFVENFYWNDGRVSSQFNYVADNNWMRTSTFVSDDECGIYRQINVFKSFDNNSAHDTVSEVVPFENGAVQRRRIKYYDPSTEQIETLPDTWNEYENGYAVKDQLPSGLQSIMKYRAVQDADARTRGLVEKTVLHNKKYAIAPTYMKFSYADYQKSAYDKHHIVSIKTKEEFSTTKGLQAKYTYYYDWEEVSAPDLNGDGVTNQTYGNIVKTVMPDVTVGSDTFHKEIWYQRYPDTAGSVNKGKLKSEIVILKRADGAERAISRTDYQYDGSGRTSRVIAFKYPGDLGETDHGVVDNGVKYTYYPNGFVHEIIDLIPNIDLPTAEGHWTETAKVEKYYDGMNRVCIETRSVKNGANWEAKYHQKTVYDDAGNVAKTMVLPGTADPQQENCISSALRLTIYAYDLQGRATDQWEILDIAGYVATPGQIEAKSAHTRFVYDRAGNLDIVIKPNENAVVTNHDGRGLVWKSCAGIPEWSENDHKWNITDVSGITTYKYDPDGRQISVTDGNGKKTETVYDSFGRPLCTIHPLVSTVNPEGYPLTFTLDCLYYDSATGDVQQVEQFEFPEGTVFNDKDNPPKWDEALRMATSFQYNALHEETARLRYNAGGAMGWEWDEWCFPGGNYALQRTIDPTGIAKYEKYDGLGRPYYSFVAGFEDKNRLALDYDWVDGVRRVVALEFDEDGYYGTISEYDTEGNLTHFGDFGNDPEGDGLITAYEYDALGNCTDVTDPKSIVTHSEYDALGRLVSKTEDYGTGKLNVSTNYRYDKNSNLIGIQDAKGNWTHYKYNSRDLLTDTYYGAVGEPDGDAPDEWVNSEILTYDNNGNVLTITKKSKQGTEEPVTWVVITNTYDAANRLLSDETTGGDYNAQPGEGYYPRLVKRSFQYDALGRITSAATTIRRYGTPAEIQSTEVVRGYDFLNLLAETQKVDLNSDGDFTDPAETLVVHYNEYDAAGRLNEFTYPAGTVVTLDRKVQGTLDDPLRRIRAVKAKWAATDHTIAEYNYIGASRLKERIYADGTKLVIGTYSGSNYVSGYDAWCRVKKYTNYGTGGSIVASFEYDYDKNSNRTWIEKSHTPFGETRFDNYTYDSLDHITEVKHDINASRNEQGQIILPPTPKWSRHIQFNLDSVGSRTTEIIDPENKDTSGNPYKVVTYGMSGNHAAQNQYGNIDTSWALPNRPSFGSTAYDTSGNMRTLSPSTEGHFDYDGANAYFFDYLNQMAVAQHKNKFFYVGIYDQFESDITKTYTYDAFGRKMATRANVNSVGIVNGADYENAERFVYDGDSTIEVYGRLSAQENFQLLEQYIHGIGVDEPVCLAMKDIWDADEDENATEWFYLFYHSNVQGDVAALTLGPEGANWQDHAQKSSGDVIERYNYDTHGRPFIEPYQPGVMAQDVVVTWRAIPAITTVDTDVDVAALLSTPLGAGDLIIVEPDDAGCILEVLGVGQNVQGDVQFAVAGKYSPGADWEQVSVEGLNIGIVGHYLGREAIAYRFDGCSKPYKKTLNRFLFQGREWDASIEAYDFRARFYSPRLGRFLSRDPAGYSDSMCLYSFVNNNPICYRDPSGRIIPLILIGAAVGAVLFAGADVYQQTEGFDFEKHPLSSLDWGRTAKMAVIGGAAGALTVATGGLVTGTGFWASVGSGALGCGAGGWFAGGATELWVDPEVHYNSDFWDSFSSGNPNATVKSVLISSAVGGIAGAGSGAVMGGAFYGLGKAWCAIFRPGAPAITQAERAAAQSVIRQRVMANIVRSRVAREASKFQNYAATERMLGLTRAANARLAANPALARTVLWKAEYVAGQSSAGIARMGYGNAVERMVADDIRASAELSGLFKHIGGPGRPDFIGFGRYAGMNFDITTNTARQILLHQARPYNPILVPYTRPPDFTVFP